MSLIQRFSNSLASKSQIFLILLTVFAVFGTLLELSGGIWDAASHLLKEPEFFWTIQHVAIYSGVGLIASSGILGFLLLMKSKLNPGLKNGIKIIILGSIIQISAGYADSTSHEIFGIDGLVSWSHQILEIGLVLSALGGWITLKNTTSRGSHLMLPITIVCLILSIIWVGFNLSLIFGNVILCVPVYEIFSSGCAIL